MANGKNAGRLYPTPEAKELLDRMKALDSDEITLRVEHTGPSPEGPTTISEEGFEALLDQFKFFVGGRVMARLDKGESVEQIDAEITLKLTPEVGNSDGAHEPEGR